MNVTTTAKAPKYYSAGEWYWTDYGDESEPTLGIGKGFEIRVGDEVDAAYLRNLALDLMKLANLVASQS
jgi:hypothetical protein